MESKASSQTVIAPRKSFRRDQKFGQVRSRALSSAAASSATQYHGHERTIRSIRPRASASNIGAGQWNRLSQSLQIPLSTSARRLKRLCRSASFGVRLHDVMQEVAESMSHVSCGDLGARWLQ